MKFSEPIQADLQREAATDISAAIRRERYRLRNHAASLTNNKRLNGCGRYRAPYAQRVEVIRTPHGNAYYRGTLRCGLIWLCPVCAPFESTRRAFALGQFASVWAERGNGLALLTLTFRHDKHDSLRQTLAALKQAYRSFTAGRGGANWRGLLGVKHSAASTEITYGANGWHPHLHVLLFRDTRMKIGTVAEAIAREHWQAAGALASVDTSHLAALDLRAGLASVAEYLAKYGRPSRQSIELETVAQHRKRGRADNLTPFELLARSKAGYLAERRAFVEYAEATRGRNMLVLSRGLREALGEEKHLRFMDTQPGGHMEPGTVEIALSPAQWRRFMRSHYSERLAVLEAIEHNDSEAALIILQRNGAYDEH